MKKNIKKILALSLVIVMMFSVNVFAADPIEFHVENQGGKKGDTVTVPVGFTSGEEVGGFEIVVYYDNEMMEFQDLKKGDLVQEEDGLFDYNAEYGDGAIKIVFVVADTVKADGVISEISFKLKKDYKDALPIGIGIDKVLDNSAESNPITENLAVSGVDEAFQEIVSKKAEEVKEERELKKDESADKDGSDLAEQTKKNETEKTAQKFQQTNQESKTGNMIVIMFILAIGVLGVIVFWRKREKYDEESKIEK